MPKQPEKLLLQLLSDHNKQLKPYQYHEKDYHFANSCGICRRANGVYCPKHPEPIEEPVRRDDEAPAGKQRQEDQRQKDYCQGQDNREEKDKLTIETILTKTILL